VRTFFEPIFGKKTSVEFSRSAYRLPINKKEPDLHLITDGISSSEYDGISSFFVPKAASRRNKTAASGSGY
jgi:hypothetical protein